MRSTLGDRLRQDAEELDRRESQIDTLASQVQELQASTYTLKSELISSHAENERVTRELDALRQSSTSAIEEATRAATAAAASKSSSSSAESTLADERDRFEVQIVHLNQTVESLKSQLLQHETARKDEVSKREKMEATARQERLYKECLEEEVSRWRAAAEREKESARNLQLVLEEFQNEQEGELQRAIDEYQQKYDATATLLEEYRERVRIAEKHWSETKDLSERGKALEQDVKEKNLLIGKLRHEAVILNEHLTEALRRLNQDNSSLTVDRRLVTNVLLQFLTTPRQDAKRFEMLSLLASVLQWSDEEKELAGIQRSGGSTGRRIFGGSGRRVSSAGAAVGGQDESFSNLFVEYLLSEADKAKAAPTSPGGTPLASVSSISGTRKGNGSQTAPAGRTNFDMESLGGSLPSPGDDGGSGGSVDATRRNVPVDFNHMASSRRSGSISTSTTSTSPTRLKKTSETAGSTTGTMWNSPVGKSIQEEKER